MCGVRDRVDRRRCVLTAPVSYPVGPGAWTRRAPRSAWCCGRRCVWRPGSPSSPGWSCWPSNRWAARARRGLELLRRAVHRHAETCRRGDWSAGWPPRLIAVVLLTVLGRTAVLTVRRRRAHRQVLDLLTRPRPGSAPGRPGRRGHRRRCGSWITAPPSRTRCPGWHSRVVLSAGLIDLLTEQELAAVIEHERAHLRARHDLLVLPFQAWAVALGRIPGVRLAGGSVAELTEMLADDVAAARTSRATLASALAKVALSGPPPAVARTGWPTRRRSPAPRSPIGCVGCSNPRRCRSWKPRRCG